MVLKARSDKWPQMNLVVKVSWLDFDQVLEGKFLKKAIEETGKTNGEWATKHLPCLFFASKVNFDDDLTCKSVAKLSKHQVCFWKICVQSTGTPHYYPGGVVPPQVTVGCEGHQPGLR